APNRWRWLFHFGNSWTSKLPFFMPALVRPPAQKPPPIAVPIRSEANRPCKVPPPPTSGLGERPFLLSSIMYSSASTVPAELAVGAPHFQPPLRPAAAGSPA